MKPQKYFPKKIIELTFSLTQKEIKSRYKNAFLGFLWIIINPLIQMLVIGFVFSHITHFNINNYHLFLFAGLLPWNFFSQAWDKATQRIVWDRNLILKAKFPRSVIPLSMVFSHFFYFFLSWGVLIIFCLVSGQFQIIFPLNFLRQVLGIVFLVILVSGISLITSCLNVFFRDIAFMVQAFILIWFYATPIIYPLSAIPEKIRIIFYLNPLSGIFTLFRSPFIDFDFPLTILIGQFVFAILVLIFGNWLFNKKEKHFTDWL